MSGFLIEITQSPMSNRPSQSPCTAASRSANRPVPRSTRLAHISSLPLQLGLPLWGPVGLTVTHGLGGGLSYGRDQRVVYLNEIRLKHIMNHHNAYLDGCGPLRRLSTMSTLLCTLPHRFPAGCCSVANLLYPCLSRTTRKSSPVHT